MPKNLSERKTARDEVLSSDFWHLCSEEWLLLGTQFCTSLSSCGYSF